MHVKLNQQQRTPKSLIECVTANQAMIIRGCGKRLKKIVGKRPKPVCWKTTETFWVVGKRPKPSCWKTAEISAVFQQCPHRIVDGLFSAVFKQLVVVVRKRPKFLPFSNKITTKWYRKPL